MSNKNSAHLQNCGVFNSKITPKTGTNAQKYPKIKMRQTDIYKKNFGKHLYLKIQKSIRHLAANGRKLASYTFT